jgi:hypothetical protein
MLQWNDVVFMEARCPRGSDGVISSEIVLVVLLCVMQDVCEVPPFMSTRGRCVAGEAQSSWRDTPREAWGRTHGMSKQSVPMCALSACSTFSVLARVHGRNL